MIGRIIQVNVSRGGLPKYAVQESYVGPLGLQGDRHAHPRFHGGSEKAVLIVCAEALEALRAQGFAVFPGALGENLTIEGVDRRFLRSGQRWRAGDALLELTTLRVPCESLTIYDQPGSSLRRALWDARTKSGDPSSPVWAMAGFYASVVQPGSVRPGAPFVLLDQSV